MLSSPECWPDKPMLISCLSKHGSWVMFANNVVHISVGIILLLQAMIYNLPTPMNQVVGSTARYGQPVVPCHLFNDIDQVCYNTTEWLTQHCSTTDILHCVVSLTWQAFWQFQDVHVAVHAKLLAGIYHMSKFIQ